ncbi:MAG: DUF3185 domain-containing protein [Ignavibacteria bacterium]
MNTRTIVGIILIVLGVAGFLVKSISFTHKEKDVDLGPLELQHEEKKTIPIPEILSGIAVVGGIVLVAVGPRKGK